MARPRVPHHLKPVPTTISLAIHHRRWMDEGNLSPSAVVNRLLDAHRADIEADREHRRAIEKVERAIHVLKNRDMEAEDLAISFVADPQNVPASRLAAMLLARVQAGEDAGMPGQVLVDLLSPSSTSESAQEAPSSDEEPRTDLEPTSNPPRTVPTVRRGACGGKTAKGKPCSRVGWSERGGPFRCSYHRGQ